MREVVSWDEYFMSLAIKASERSKDPSTQVGALLVDNDRNVIMTGYNGFAPGAPDTPALWDEPLEKYPRVIHAELNAIARAAKVGRATGGAILYVNYFPCTECAKVIAAAGIKRVCYHTLMERWNPMEAAERLVEAGVDFDCCGE